MSIVPKPQKVCKMIALNPNNSHKGHYFTYFWGPGSPYDLGAWVWGLPT